MIRESSDEDVFVKSNKHNKQQPIEEIKGQEII